MLRDKSKSTAACMIVLYGGLVMLGLILTFRHLGMPQRFQTRSASSSSSSTMTMMDPAFQNCTGTAAERRALASLANQATAQDWLDMASCVSNRRRQAIHGHLFLHVSKSGGTSICEFIQQKQNRACYQSDLQNDHCQIPGPPINTGPHWMNTIMPDSFRMPNWMPFDQNVLSDPTCDEMKNFTQQHDVKFLMKENFLPRSKDGVGGTACTESFWTSLIVRDPVERILSHYNHIRHFCETRNEPGVCDEAMLDNTNSHFFNFSVMAKHFHLVTDNYYLRSLSNMDIFGSTNDVGNDKALLKRALRVLRSIDWIMPLKDEEALMFVLHHGLGLEGSLNHANTNHAEHKKVTEQEFRLLHRWNRADYVLYKEALRLHKLDVVSIEKMQQHAPGELVAAAPKKTGNEHLSCCGVIC